MLADVNVLRRLPSNSVGLGCVLGWTAAFLLTPITVLIFQAAGIETPRSWSFIAFKATFAAIVTPIAAARALIRSQAV